MNIKKATHIKLKKQTQHKKQTKQLYLWSAILMIPAIVLYCLIFIIYKDFEGILKDFLSQLAFLPIFYIFYTIIIDKLLTAREKQTLIEKLNVVIGAFFTEAGIRLFIIYKQFESDFDNIGRHLASIGTWKESDYIDFKNYFVKNDYKIDSRDGDLDALKAYVLTKKDFLLRLMESPNLIAHETFTEMLLSLFHLVEELESRDSLSNLPEADYRHLSGDMRRMQDFLIVEWANYMKHLKNEYPYLFSIAVSKNPFDPSAKIEIA
jgi:hypothetical protein